MDHWNPPEGFSQPEFPGAAPRRTAAPPSNRLHNNTRAENSSHRIEQDVKSCIASRKVQKADREKLRRDRQNEQFLELGNALDPDRPKNDKATILTDTIQMLKDLTAQVNRLKTEYVSLTEESRELTQEKNELREEKAALKSEIDNLNAQYQQRLRLMYPWMTMDPSVVVGPPPPYPFPVHVPIPPGAIPIHHPSVQPYPFFRNQNSGAIANPSSTFMPYSSQSNPHIEQPSTHHNPLHPYPGSNKSDTSSRQDSRSKSSDRPHGSSAERSEDFSDVATELELKTPGSSVPSSHSEAAREQEHLSEGRKGKQRVSPPMASSVSEGKSSSKCSSSSALPDTSSSSVGDGSIADKR